MKEAFEEWNPRSETLERVAMANKIIREYRAAGYILTLRQLYYQFVARDLIPNTERSYKNLGTAISKARLAGMLDWAAIEDRGRRPDTPSEYDDLAQLVEAALYSYRLPRWEGQDNYVELWVEKAALAGVLAPLASRYHVTLMVNKGYSSQSAMYESAQRIRTGSEDCENATVLYLGDHDPSGQDMVRDISDRLNMFIGSPHGVNVELIALTTDQVEEHEPPPNPTKLTDSRAGGYIERHGHECWEVDALDPATLQGVIESAFAGLVDLELMDEVKEREESDKDRLREAVANLIGDSP